MTKTAVQVTQELIAAEVKKAIGDSNRKAPWGVDGITPLQKVSLTKRLETSDSKDELNIRFQKMNDEIYMLSKYSGLAPSHFHQMDHFNGEWQEIAKALNISTDGAGAEWIPTGILAKNI